MSWDLHVPNLSTEKPQKTFQKHYKRNGQVRWWGEGPKFRHYGVIKWQQMPDADKN